MCGAHHAKAAGYGNAGYLKYRDATVGLQYVAARTPTGLAITGVDYSTDQQAFVLSNLVMYNLQAENTNAATAVDLKVWNAVVAA